MSNASITSSKKEAHREKLTSDLMLELDSVRALNSSLRAYLQHLRAFKKNLAAMNENCSQLSKVNTQWIETLNKIKGCLEVDETVAHVILECMGVAHQRAEILTDVRSLREACESPRKILSFWAELGWLD